MSVVCLRLKATKGKLMTTNEIIAQAAQAEMDSILEWESRMSGSHFFSYELDEDVPRCEKCGINRLSAVENRKCDNFLS